MRVYRTPENAISRGLIALGLVLTLHAARPVAVADVPQSIVIDTVVLGDAFTFYDRYEFGPNDRPPGAVAGGDLWVGGVEVVYTVTVYIPESREIVTRIKVPVLVNGQIAYEVRTIVTTITIQKPVQETRSAYLPQVRGRWTAAAGAQQASWNFFQRVPGGFLQGAGTTDFQSLEGTALYFNVPPIPTGGYVVLSADP